MLLASLDLGQCQNNGLWLVPHPMGLPHVIRIDCRVCTVRPSTRPVSELKCSFWTRPGLRVRGILALGWDDSPLLRRELQPKRTSLC